MSDPLARQIRETLHGAVTTAPDTDDAPLQYRTLAAISDDPPAPLLLDMLEPDGPNLLYGGGGVGKGTTCTYIMRDCLRQDIRPLIYDAELHPKEWARRASGLGVERDRIVYVQPRDLPAHLIGRPMWDIVPHLARISEAEGCGIIILDSILASMNLSEEGLKSDAGAPYRYVAALDEIGIPSVSIGHTAKNSAEGDPYGSVSWVNAMRLTWLGTRAEGEGHRVRWTPRKRNERGHIAPFLLVFEYDERGRLCGVTREDDEQTTRSWIMAALAAGPRTVDDMADEMADADDGPHTQAVARAKDRLRQTLGRMRRAGLVHRAGKKRGSPWALGAEPEKSDRRRAA